MADPAHLEIAKKGTKAIALWRQTHPGEHMDLSDALLSRRKLREVDVAGANLTRARLVGCDL
ncbi:MAG TPA: pentapeptide repeat-containing protein, partial [Dehalococcoidia bacterium]|nr:pentapeptide repeat-containing protein [Dehalococcoidia bacterium]